MKTIFYFVLCFSLLFNLSCDPKKNDDDGTSTAEIGNNKEIEGNLTYHHSSIGGGNPEFQNIEKTLFNFISPDPDHFILNYFRETSDCPFPAHKLSIEFNRIHNIFRVENYIYPPEGEILCSHGGKPLSSAVFYQYLPYANECQGPGTCGDGICSMLELQEGECADCDGKTAPDAPDYVACVSMNPAMTRIEVRVNFSQNGYFLQNMDLNMPQQQLNIFFLDMIILRELLPPQ